MKSLKVSRCVTQGFAGHKHSSTTTNQSAYGVQTPTCTIKSVRDAVILVVSSPSVTVVKKKKILQMKVEVINTL